jgi:hypothetical protein
MNWLDPGDAFLTWGDEFSPDRYLEYTALSLRYWLRGSGGLHDPHG